MAKIKQADGTEIEAFTPEEVEAKLKDKEAEINKGWEMKTAESKTALDVAQADKKKLEDQIAAGGGQGENFKTLKAALDKKDADIIALQGSISKIEEDRVNGFRDQTIKKMVGNDKELEKKVLHHFNETLKSVPAKTQEEISTKLASAFKLSVDTVTPNILAQAMSGAGGPGFAPNSGGVTEFSPAEVALGNKLGITDEDRKKYGPRLKAKK